MQTVIPGRDPSLSDIIFNTAGAAAGALLGYQPLAWLRPGSRLGSVMTAASVAVFAITIWLTAALLSPTDAQFSIVPVGTDVVLSYTTRASTFGLDEPEYRLHDALQNPQASPMVRATRYRSTWLIDTGQTQPARLGPTIGQGWALLAYPDAIGRRWGWIVNAVWIAALCLPIGYFARPHVVAFAIVSVATLLLIVPLSMGVAPTSGAEWLGAAAGFAIGLALARAIEPRASRHRVIATPRS